MAESFHLLDLPSQALAVQRLLSGRPEGEKVAWLAAHGKLSIVDTTHFPGARSVYRLDSVLGLGCLFFIDGDQFVFIGDHTTYTIKG
jgi:hypothetical protein